MKLVLCFVVLLVQAAGSLLGGWGTSSVNSMYEVLADADRVYQDAGLMALKNQTFKDTETWIIKFIGKLALNDRADEQSAVYKNLLNQSKKAKVHEVSQQVVAGMNYKIVVSIENKSKYEIVIYVPLPYTKENPVIQSITKAENQRSSTRIRFQLESGVHYPKGSNLKKCGSYNTRAELEAACKAAAKCIAYSTITYKNTGAVAENGFYPWCLKTSAGRRKKNPTHNYYRKVVEACNDKSIWTKQVALENCPARFSSKRFGVTACKSFYQTRLEVSLANQLYGACGSRCVYDYDTIIADGKGAFLYRRRRKCYKYVTKGGCFKMKKYGEAIKRAKKIC